MATGQPTYQNPSSIQRQQAPTGDLYAMPEKGKGKGSRRQAPTTPSAENATYQDPNTIEHQQAPTGALYAMPEKKPKYTEVQKQNVGQEKCLSVLFISTFYPIFLSLIILLLHSLPLFSLF